MLRFIVVLFALVAVLLAHIPSQTYNCKPYGELANHDGNATNGFLFTGEQLDAEANNYYLRARYYSPSLTRFLSRDTYDGKTSDPLSQNHYLYAGGNPVMFVDPSGHMSILELQVITMNIGGRFAARFPVLRTALEITAGAVAPMELSLSTPYAWTGFATASAIHSAQPLVHKMAATSLSLKKVKSDEWYRRMQVGKNWEDFVFDDLLKNLNITRRQVRLKNGTNLNTGKSGYVIADAIYGGSIIEVKTTAYGGARMYKQAKLKGTN